jgi:ABC-type transport system involved in multi-copper enzyme maturation permease subunit
MIRLALTRYRRSRHFWTALILAAIPLLGASVFSLVFLLGSGFALSNPLAIEVPLLDLSIDESRMSDVVTSFQYIFKAAFLHFGVIFAALSFANSVIREESAEQTLHYLLLQPTRRWVIVIGKYIAFMLMALPCFVISLVLVKFLLLLPFGGEGIGAFFSGENISLTLKEIAVMLLAISSFTALFLGLSNIFKNPIVPLMIYGWEAAVSFLPAVLKQYSITYYLKSMLPAASTGPASAIEFMAEGPSTLQTILVLTLLPVVCVGITCWRASRQECLYSD